MHGRLAEFGCSRCAELGAAAGAATEWKAFPMPGAPTQWSRDRKFDVKHLALDVAIDPEKKSIAGTATHTIVPFLDGLTSVVLDC